MKSTLVMKFGGTSVGSPGAIERAAAIVAGARADWANIVVIVSAMSGTTDGLLAGAMAAAAGDRATPAKVAAELRDRHRGTALAVARLTEADALLAVISMHVAEFESLCHAIGVLGEASPRALDAIAALGERMNAPIVAAAIRKAGAAAEAIDAAGLVITDATHQSATPDMDLTRQRVEAIIHPMLMSGTVPVVTGFIGSTPTGVVTTLGRGGSDYSGAIFGVALQAAEVWIWTDVNGVMTADPRVAPGARTLKELSFREISELAFYGAKVLHPKTIRPVVEQRVGLWVKNTFCPSNAGTRIVLDNGAVPGSIKAVTAFKGQCIVTLEGRGMLGIPGIAARTFAAVARTGTSVSMISQASSEQSICFVVPHGASSLVLRALEAEFQSELARRDIDSISASSESAIVTVVGAGMRHTPGIAGRIFGALGDSGVNVVAIAQGSSECSISLVVAAEEADEAVRAIHALIA
jgi:bifunctional aspartokinase / homoserine dehydrogenase 1